MLAFSSDFIQKHNKIFKIQKPKFFSFVFTSRRHLSGNFTAFLHLKK